MFCTSSGNAKHSDFTQELAHWPDDTRLCPQMALLYAGCLVLVEDLDKEGLRGKTSGNNQKEKYFTVNIKNNFVYGLATMEI